MSRKSTCRCLICTLERSLTAELEGDHCQEPYQRFASSRSVLSGFPTPADLIAYMHVCRNANDGTHRVDHILLELLRGSATNGDAAFLRDLLLLAFVPMLHSTMRRVAARYPSLSTDDIAQHAVSSLLQTLRAPEFCGRTSHVAFAISRILKRNTFTWAERECRSPVYGGAEDMLSDSTSASEAAEPIERAALLRHFLHRCHQRGLLTDKDIELLVEFKLDAPRDRKHGGPAAAYSNASRQRMKRLLGKLRRIAQTRPFHPSRADNEADGELTKN